MTYFRKPKDFSPPLATWFDTSYKHPTPTVTLTDVPGIGLKVDVSSSTGTEQRIALARSTANWGTAYRARTRIKTTLWGSYPGPAMGFYDSAGGKAVVVSVYSNASTFEYAVSYLSNIYTWSSNDKVVGGFATEINWFEVERAGDTIYFRVSADGNNWQSYSLSTTGWLPVAPTHVVAMFNPGVANFSPTQWGGLITYWDDPDYPISSRIT
jgi:hypothetical protein